MTRAKECFRNALDKINRSRSQSDPNSLSDLESENAENVAESLEKNDTPVRDRCSAFNEDLLEDEQLQKSLLPQLYVNYGNSLAELGRLIEAIDMFETALKHDGEHPMAWVRLGQSLLQFTTFVRDPKILEESINALQEACKDDRLEKYGYGFRRSKAESSLLKAQELYKNVSRRSGEHKKPSIPSPYHERYVDFCVKNRLFLNFSLERVPSPHPFEDKFEFSVKTPISDRERFPRLVRPLNELIERFSISRLLIFEAHEMPYDSVFYDSLTPYIDLTDASQYGIRIAKLKLAYESAFNILDKLALFLNFYLELGLEPKKVDFFSLWSKRAGLPNALLRPEIEKNQNNFVFALYDMACDFGRNVHGEDGAWSDLKTTRNLLTHRYLVFHAFEFDWQVVDGSEYHRTWSDMMEATQSLLYITRNALLYLVLAIQLEEARREKRKEPGDKEAVTFPYHLHKPDTQLID